MSAARGKRLVDAPGPSGIDVEIDQGAGKQTVKASAGKTIEVTVQLFGTAGLPDEEGDTIKIVAAK